MKIILIQDIIYSPKVNNQIVSPGFTTIMPNYLLKLTSSLKPAAIAMLLVLLAAETGFARVGTKLYSIGTNLAWNSASSWSLKPNGPSAGLLPQSTDTLVVGCTIVQNIDFVFAGNGRLIIEANGLVRGENQDLTFNATSAFVCAGELRSNNLIMNQNATLSTLEGSKLILKNTFVSNTLGSMVVDGSIISKNQFFVYSGSSVRGTGCIESVHFAGNGEAFNLDNISLLPDGSVITENNWTGLNNQNWNDAGNWSGNSIPESGSNISILPAEKTPLISESFTCASITLNAGATLAVSPGVAVEVSDKLVILGNGSLIMRNTLTNKSSLIYNGEVTGSIKVECPVKANTPMLFCSPVESATSGAFVNMYMRTYDEITSQWGSYILPTNDPLGEMQGYEVYSLNSDTRVVEGNLNLNEKIYNLTNYGSGLNLTGNPFTAYIDWESNSKDIKRDDIASAIYYPSQSGSGNYAVYLPGGDDAVSLNGGSRYIAPMQGFFVKAINDGTLSFGNSSRLASLADSRTSIRNNAIKFRLTDGNNGTDEVLFRVLSGTTDQFDDASDAVKITPSAEVSYLTLHGDDELDYSVATVPAVSSDKTYKMSVFCKQETDFQLSGIGAVNFDFRYPVYLYDKQLGIYKDLRADSVYSFTHSPEMESQRFEIIFTAPDGISEIPAEIARVNVNNKLVTLKGSSTKHFEATLSTIDGKLIAVASGSPVEGISLAAGLRNPQVCILHLYNEKQSFTQKILIP